MKSKEPMDKEVTHHNGKNEITFTKLLFEITPILN
jgi:hypothetical protein